MSVVIATNRNGVYLADAVRSVQAQSRGDAEIIVVDDGCPSSDIWDQATRLGVRYARQQHAGVSVARNHGARIASGAWVAFLDDDDLWHPDRIASQLHTLAENPQAVGCCSGGWNMDASGSPIGESWPAGSGKREQVLAGDVPLPRMITMLIRRSAFQDVGGFSPTLRIAEDKDLVLRLLRLGDIVATEAALVGYRRHDHNTTRGDILFARLSSLRSNAMQVWAAEALKDESALRLVRRRLSRCRQAEGAGAVRDAVAALRNGRFTTAARSLEWALRYAPASVVRTTARAVADRVAPARRPQLPARAPDSQLQRVRRAD